jgi:16S rRNA processing protein RimM
MTAGRSSVAPLAGIPPTAPEPTAIPVADILGAHGLRGLLRVRPCQPDSPVLVPGARVFVERGGSWGTTELATVAPHGHGHLLVSIDGIADRTAAEGMARARLLVRAADLPALEDGEFYWHEVVGYTVETLAGARVGTVADTMSTGLNDVWIVRDGEREYLIPVIADVVREFDRAGRRIVIEPLPGLLD